MVFLGVYYTLLDFGGVGAGGYTLTNKKSIGINKAEVTI